METNEKKVKQEQRLFFAYMHCDAVTLPVNQVYQFVNPDHQLIRLWWLESAKELKKIKSHAVCY